MQNLIFVAARCAALTLALFSAPLRADGAGDGRELFTREWLPGDPRAGGDGLGPVFNDTSCGACHNQGGIGGGGPAEKNVHIITPFARTAATAEELRDAPSLARRQREQLAQRHPGFRSAHSVVLHRFGADDDYAEWRRKLGGFGFGAIAFFDGPMQGFARREQVRRDVSLPRPRVTISTEADGPFQLVQTERNPPALFGAGAIDTIPDEAILAAARREKGFPEVKGRIARLQDGRLGRFGWKAQMARLHDFVLNACAVELGLDVPGEPQAGDPMRPDYVPAACDLSAVECEALTRYVAALPAPAERPPSFPGEEVVIAAGRARFEAIGCESCHRRTLGSVRGIYSDLLLHDMGPDLGDISSYDTFVPNATEAEELAQPLSVFNGPATFGATGRAAQAGGSEKDAEIVGARRLEWRTPPLWGVRDSTPYLHDGRAATLEEAIAMHGGEAQRTSQRFFDLPAAERMQVILFLKSLVAP